LGGMVTLTRALVRVRARVAVRVRVRVSIRARIRFNLGQIRESGTDKD
jgi:hypothetical protein